MRSDLSLWCCQRAAGIGADEIDDFGNFRRSDIGAGRVLKSFLEGALLGEQETVGGAKGVDGLARKASTFKPDEIQTFEVGVITPDVAIGNDVVIDTGHAANESMATNADILVRG